MKHLGDITKLKGNEIPKVDIITGGSPCQDLSVAGKREGLAGERSGLFMEQIRLIKEMREDDRANGRTVEHIRPRYMVWENVPGAFSSNKGEDFRCVLEETAKIADSNATIPRLATGKDGKQKWSKSGAIMGDGWSIAWRVHDAQFWGVPQRRKRISLVADFAGGTAPEILFEPKSLYGNTETSREEGQGTTTDAEGSVGETSCYYWHSQYLTVNEIKDNVSPTLPAAMGMGGASMTTPMLIKQETSKCLNSWDVQSKHIQPEEGIAEALYSGECRGGGGESYVLQKTSAAVQGADVYNGQLTGGKAATLTSACGGTNTSGAKVCYRKKGHPQNAEQGQGWEQTETNDTLNAFDNGESRTPTVVLENHPNDSRVKIREDGTVQTLSSRMGTGGGNVPLVFGRHHDVTADDITPSLCAKMGTGGNNVPMVMEEPYNATTGSFMRAGNSGVAETLAARDYKDPQIVCNSVVRRLTPLECERLQGYPDGWTDIGEWYDSKGKKHKDADSPRYKALGNSIALPFWQWMAERMVKHLKNPSMGSLFDGIGGFPLVYSRVGCQPIWASEIEEFPMAVTKIRFPDDEVIQ